jgi:hypothetical protein
MDEFGNLNSLINKPWTAPSMGYMNPAPNPQAISPYSPAYADPFNFQNIPKTGPVVNSGFIQPPYQGQGINIPSPGGPAVNLPAGYQSGITAPSFQTAPDNTDPGAATSTPDSDIFKLSPAQAGIGAAPGIIGGLYAGFSNMAKKNNLEREDLTPDAVRSGAEDAFRREKSALTPNYGESVDRISRRAGDVIKTAERAGGSAGDVINAAVAANNMAGNQLFDLEQAGVNRQSQNRARGDQYRSTLGEYERLSDDRFKQQYAAYDNASKDSFMSAFNTAAGFGMMTV